jgi:hypothetical protein
MKCSICGGNTIDVLHTTFTHTIYNMSAMEQFKYLMRNIEYNRHYQADKLILSFVKKHLPYLYENYNKLSILQ